MIAIVQARLNSTRLPNKVLFKIKNIKLDLRKNKETLEKDSISFSSKSNSPLKIYKSGDYWIEAKISTDENTFDVYDSIKINLLSENEKSVFYYLEEIERPVLILSIITVLVGIFGVRMLRN